MAISGWQITRLDWQQAAARGDYSAAATVPQRPTGLQSGPPASRAAAAAAAAASKRETLELDRGLPAPRAASYPPNFFLVLSSQYSMIFSRKE